jgi:hypothetical protein
MQAGGIFGGSSGDLRRDHEPVQPKLVVVQKSLRRILAFTGLSIDDVVDSPFAKREVIKYYKVDRTVSRRTEILELEEQWNSF